MTDYIKREDALKALREYPVTKLKTAIRRLPSADVVAVVRCKDCKWRYQNQQGDVFCINPHGMGDKEYWVNDNWYCHHGERKDDEID